MSHTPDESNWSTEEICWWVYDLSYFILGDKDRALNVASQAIGRLKITMIAQQKREAKRPKLGSQKKISLTDQQILQYLTYIYAEIYERIQEEAHLERGSCLTANDLILRYLKHLMVIYLERNSLFATVGQGCVLYPFGTTPVERIYEVVVQSSELRLLRYDDLDGRVREAKREIKRRLVKRFEPFVTACQGARGELQISTIEDASRFLSWVNACLERLRPASRADSSDDEFHLPEKFDPSDSDLQELKFEGEGLNPSDENAVERRRLHVVTHPPCWAKLLKACGLDLSPQMLRLPAFKAINYEIGDDVPPRQPRPPGLTSLELSALQTLLRKEKKRQKLSLTTHLSITVDGKEHSVWHLDKENEKSLKIEKDAKLLEIRACYPKGDEAVALILLQIGREEMSDGTLISRIELDHQELTVIADYRSLGEGGAGDLDVKIGFEEHRPLRSIGRSLIQKWQHLQAGLPGATNHRSLSQNEASDLEIEIELPARQPLRLHQSMLADSPQDVKILSTPPPQELTHLLVRWSSGDQVALEQLMPLVHQDLLEMARKLLRPARSEQTFTVSGPDKSVEALVNEAYLRLIDSRHLRPRDRAHFFAICAQSMRRILVEFARGGHKLERGGTKPHMFPAEELVMSDASDLVALDDALKVLASVDERKSRVVELRFFGGMSVEETAEALDISVNTVIREWAFARAWLHQELSKENDYADTPESKHD